MLRSQPLARLLCPLFAASAALATPQAAAPVEGPPRLVVPGSTVQVLRWSAPGDRSTVCTNWQISA